jgi:hypothetical protein
MEPEMLGSKALNSADQGVTERSWLDGACRARLADGSAKVSGSMYAAVRHCRSASWALSLDRIGIFAECATLVVDGSTVQGCVPPDEVFVQAVGP